MNDLYDFLYSINDFLSSKGYDRLEETLAGATFSALVSELVVQSLSKNSSVLTKNTYHNGRPDLVPSGVYPNNGILRGNDGVEIKALRYESGWQGHNIESGWIMIFQYRIDTQTQPTENRGPTKFERVLCAKLDESDWSFSGKRTGSRRTITASIRQSGVRKLEANAVYLDPSYVKGRRRTT